MTALWRVLVSSEVRMVWTWKVRLTSRIGFAIALTEKKMTRKRDMMVEKVCMLTECVFLILSMKR